VTKTADFETNTRKKNEIRSRDFITDTRHTKHNSEKYIPGIQDKLDLDYTITINVIKMAYICLS